MIISSLQEFYSFFEPNKPLLAIDYGNKKIGLAISNQNHTMAMPHSMILAAKEEEKLVKITDFLEKYNICAVIVGLPINMDGSTGKQSEIVTNFARKLAARTNLPIYLQDERLTSKAASSLLKNIGLRRKQRDKIDDMTAASLILETVVNSVRNL